MSPSADIHNLNKTIVHVFHEIIIKLVKITRYNNAAMLSYNHIYTCNGMFTNVFL